MNNIPLSLDEIFDLAKKTLLANGCDDETASILSNLIRNAERDGSVSHGLFRLPAYVSGLKSGKINGKGKPEINKVSSSVIKVQGNNCLAPVVLSKGLPELSKAAKENGVAVLAICPDKTAGTTWQKHAEEFFEKMKSMGEVRLPGERRHKNRLDTGPRHINEELVNKIKSLS